MRGLLLISHGQYAEAFKGSLEMIAGETTNVYSVCLEPNDGPDQFTEKLENLQSEFDKYDNILVFADLFGGSPCNATIMKYTTDDKFNFIAGMNFPMVLTAILTPEETIDSLVATGQEGIVDVRKMMASFQSDDE